jgi:L-aspartate oxidase
MKKSGDDFVFLDITHLPGYRIRERFPNLYQKCLTYGIDMCERPVPVVPAVHYSCGGIKVDENGRSSIKGLYATGETACSGTHGANRLASNSLLEALVLSSFAAEMTVKERKENQPFLESALPWDTGNAVSSDENVVVSHNWDEIRRIMWDYVGIVRSDKRLNMAKQRIEILKKEIKEYYWNFMITTDLIELRNIITVADIILKSAEYRKESRGLHYNLNYPRKDNKNWKRDTIIQMKNKRDVFLGVEN